MNSEKKNSELPDIATKIFEILSNFFMDLESYRELNRHICNLERNDPSRPLWIVLSNNCLMMAAVEWCKIFGSEHNNVTHYTKCIDKLEGIETTVNEMKEFRDKYISHYDFYNKPIPFMDKAVNVIIKFDEAVVKKYGLGYQETISEAISYYREDIHKRFSLIVSGKG